MENVWFAVATGIMGQKTKYMTPYYPDGTFNLTGALGPAGLQAPTDKATRPTLMRQITQFAHPFCHCEPPCHLPDMH